MTAIINIFFFPIFALFCQVTADLPAYADRLDSGGHDTYNSYKGDGLKLSNEDQSWKGEGENRLPTINFPGLGNQKQNGNPEGEQGHLSLIPRLNQHADRKPNPWFYNGLPDVGSQNGDGYYYAGGRPKPNSYIPGQRPYGSFPSSKPRVWMSSYYFPGGHLSGLGIPGLILQAIKPTNKPKFPQEDSDQSDSSDESYAQSESDEYYDSSEEELYESEELMENQDGYDDFEDDDGTYEWTEDYSEYATEGLEDELIRDEEKDILNKTEGSTKQPDDLTQEKPSDEVKPEEPEVVVAEESNREKIEGTEESRPPADQENLIVETTDNENSTVSESPEWLTTNKEQ